jgi:transposase
MPKYTQPRKTWQYSNEFKVKAVQLSLIEGIQIQELANTLDIHLFCHDGEKNTVNAGRGR